MTEEKPKLIKALEGSKLTLDELILGMQPLTAMVVNLTAMTGVIVSDKHQFASVRFTGSSKQHHVVKPPVIPPMASKPAKIGFFQRIINAIMRMVGK